MVLQGSHSSHHFDVAAAIERASVLHPHCEIVQEPVTSLENLSPILSTLATQVPEVPRRLFIIAPSKLYKQLVAVASTDGGGGAMILGGHDIFDGIRVDLDDRIQAILVQNRSRVRVSASQIVDRLKSALVANANTAAVHDLQYRIYTGGQQGAYQVFHKDELSEWKQPDQVIGLYDDMLSLISPVWVAVVRVGYSDSTDDLTHDAEGLLLPVNEVPKERIDMVITVQIPFHGYFEKLQDLPEYVDIRYFVRNDKQQGISKVYQARVSHESPVIGFDLMNMGIESLQERPFHSDDELGHAIRMHDDEAKNPGAWLIKHSISPRVLLDQSHVISWLDTIFHDREVEAGVYYNELKIKNSSCTIL
ncbi:uncharacterized protein V1516DRAFT_262949 [Lipomyces oligophaga]|uniref:uncharacterized protein n=1 Tax=Lipomyces oligophaga TaxID=45792 RepID=UPI0034CEEEC4